MTVPATWADPGTTWADPETTWTGGAIAPVVPPPTGWDAVVATSREHLAAALLYSADGVPLGDLPLSGGEVIGTARPGDRWSGRLLLAGREWVPTTADHPLAGMVGAWVRVQVGTVSGRDTLWEHLADLIVWQTTVRRDAATYEVSVQLVGLAGWVAAAAPRDYRPTPAETCQQMIRRLVDTNRPPGWPPVTVADTSTPVPVPADYATQGTDAWQAVQDLAAIANVTVYADRDGRLVIRPPLPSTPVEPLATLAWGVNLTGWDLSAGRGDGFANRVELRCAPVQADGTPPLDDVVGVAQVTTGPLSVGAAGAVVYSERRTTGTVSQAVADARAAAVLATTARAWVGTVLSCLPDPRLGPDTDVSVDYGTVVVPSRVSEVRVPLDTAAMTVAVRALTDTPTIPTALPARKDPAHA